MRWFKVGDTDSSGFFICIELFKRSPGIINQLAIAVWPMDRVRSCNIRLSSNTVLLHSSSCSCAQNCAWRDPSGPAREKRRSKEPLSRGKSIPGANRTSRRWADKRCIAARPRRSWRSTSNADKRGHAANSSAHRTKGRDESRSRPHRTVHEER